MLLTRPSLMSKVSIITDIILLILGFHVIKFQKSELYILQAVYNMACGYQCYNPSQKRFKVLTTFSFRILKVLNVSRNSSRYFRIASKTEPVESYFCFIGSL